MTPTPSTVVLNLDLSAPCAGLIADRDALATLLAEGEKLQQARLDINAQEAELLKAATLDDGGTIRAISDLRVRKEIVERKIQENLAATAPARQKLLAATSHFRRTAESAHAAASENLSAQREAIISAALEPHNAALGEAEVRLSEIKAAVLATNFRPDCDRDLLGNAERLLAASAQ